jgi:CIC family chloride channel protein
MKKYFSKLKSHNVDHLDEARIRLARPDALLQLSLLGLLSGLLAGFVIIVFRLVVEETQDWLLPGSGSENFELLSDIDAFLFPLLGAVAIAVMFRWIGRDMPVLGVARVMERMNYHQGHLTVRGFVLQFFGAAFAIIGGHSVGREGPHIFLGAAAGSLMGQYLSLPNNAIRTFVACGTAAGIAASFNTPLAGVIFALEVVMMEYTVASFIPVILAAVSATTLSNAVFGNEPAFSIPATSMGSNMELGIVVILGVIAGGVSAGFVHLLQEVALKSRDIAIWWRVMIAGISMGIIAILTPEVMGIGYDTVDLALNAQIGLSLLISLVFVKVAATAVVVGLGVPGGMIGPTLFIGAMLGAAIGNLAMLLPFEVETHIGFFALLGMGAMMSASLQAPLAALVAMLELTDNPAIILPGMLAVVVAGVTSSELFRKESLFISMMKAAGKDYNTNPVLQTLRRSGVAGIMERNFVHVGRQITRKRAKEILLEKTAFILVDYEGETTTLMPAVELAKYMEATDPGNEEEIDLMSIPAERLQVTAIDLQANCQQAYEKLQPGSYDALFVERRIKFGGNRIYGVLSKDMIEKAYRY